MRYIHKPTALCVQWRTRGVNFRTTFIHHMQTCRMHEMHFHFAFTSVVRVCVHVYRVTHMCGNVAFVHTRSKSIAIKVSKPNYVMRMRSIFFLFSFPLSACVWVVVFVFRFFDSFCGVLICFCSVCDCVLVGCVVFYSCAAAHRRHPFSFGFKANDYCTIISCFVVFATIRVYFKSFPTNSNKVSANRGKKFRKLSCRQTDLWICVRSRWEAIKFFFNIL